MDQRLSQLGLVILLLPGCDKLAGDVYHVTINQNGVEIQEEAGGIEVPLPEPRPYPYTKDPYPFGDNVTFSSMSAGWNHICALRLDGEIECRGDDEHGETYPPPGPWTAVYAGYQGSCGRKTDGSFECWGFDPAHSDWSQPTGSAWPTGISLTMLAPGRRWMCALDDSGVPACWAGYDSDVNYSPATALDSVEVGVGSACGMVSGTDSITCWGNNSGGQLDVPAGSWSDVSFSKGTPCGLRTDGSITCWGDDRPPFFDNMPPGRDFVDVAVKEDRLCAMHEDGRIACFSVGRREWQLYEGNYVEMAVGQTFTCGRTVEGYIRCFGMLAEPAPIDPQQ